MGKPNIHSIDRLKETGVGGKKAADVQPSERSRTLLGQPDLFRGLGGIAEIRRSEREGRDGWGRGCGWGGGGGGG